MSEVTTTCFGQLSYHPEQVIHFPAGLPAFEEETAFLPIERPATAPVIFLQSLSRPDLAFITLPILLADPDYRLDLAPADLEALGLPTDRQPEIGADVLCLAIVTVPESRIATANLMAPIVMNVATRRAFQAIQTDAGYSHQHVLSASPAEGPCL